MDTRHPRVLAIDPGTHCGYAWIDVPQPTPEDFRALGHQAGVWELKPDRFASQGMRFVHLKRMLIDVSPDFIVYEQVNFSHKSTAAAQMYWGVVTTLQLFCEEHGVEYAGVTTGVVKKRATGKGNAGKPDMVNAANEFFRLEPALSTSKSSSNTDDNVADALWLLQIGLETYGDVLTLRDPSKAKEDLKQPEVSASDVVTPSKKKGDAGGRYKPGEW